MLKWSPTILLLSLSVVFMSEFVRQEEGATPEEGHQQEQDKEEEEMGQALTYIRRKDTQAISFEELADDIRASK